MDRDEIMNLIDDLALAALNYDLAKSNLEKWEKMYNKLLEQFNNNIEKVDEEDGMYIFTLEAFQA